MGVGEPVDQLCIVVTMAASPPPYGQHWGHSTCTAPAVGAEVGADVGLVGANVGAALGAEVTGSQMPVTTFNAVLPVSQSANSTGHFVVASSPAAKQQQMRFAADHDAAHVE